MRRLAIGLIVAMFMHMAVGVRAQPVPRIYWDHDGANVTEFFCQIDSGTLMTLGMPTPSGTTYSALLSACGTLTTGSHLIYVYADNGTTPSPPSTGIHVVKL